MLYNVYLSYFVYSGLPSNISYNWNFGSILGIILALQIVTGIILGMHYAANIDIAFLMVEHIMRDIEYGWLIRYLHANGASLFFLFVYLHIGRSIYAGSYIYPRHKLWNIGVVIFLIMMGTAFLGYVLPFGQMSLWGATVITNLLSAIPYLGMDLVVLNDYLCNNFPIIGIISPHARKKIVNKDYLKNIPYKFLAMFTGFIDGDGYISITKSKKNFITIKLVISLKINELLLLEYFKSVLKIGKIYIYKDTCVYIINRTDLQEILFPLLNYHNIFFLTKTRQIQYEKALYIFKKNIKMFNEIPLEIPQLFNLNISINYYINLKFFENWIVGFTMAEGSFLIKKNNDTCFQLKQRKHELLFESFKLIFGTSRKIELEQNLYNSFSVSSIKDIQNVINFFSFSGHHTLYGYKYLQYEKWLEYLSKSKRYNKLNFHNNK